MFSLRERDLSEFKDMCLYHQTSPHSHFTQSKLCSLATEKGRITVTADKIKIKEGDTITELPVNSEEEFLSGLEKYFNIRLHENVLSQPA
jgi:N-hydroxyarylamine O-acetyltransferase